MPQKEKRHQKGLQESLIQNEHIERKFQKKIYSPGEMEGRVIANTKSLNYLSNSFRDHIVEIPQNILPYNIASKTSTQKYKNGINQPESNKPSAFETKLSSASYLSKNTKRKNSKFPYLSDCILPLICLIMVLQVIAYVVYQQQQQCITVKEQNATKTVDNEQKAQVIFQNTTANKDRMRKELKKDKRDVDKVKTPQFTKQNRSQEDSQELSVQSRKNNIKNKNPQLRFQMLVNDIDIKVPAVDRKPIGSNYVDIPIQDRNQQTKLNQTDNSFQYPATNISNFDTPILKHFAEYVTQRTNSRSCDRVTESLKNFTNIDRVELTTRSINIGSSNFTINLQNSTDSGKDIQNTNSSTNETSKNFQYPSANISHSDAFIFRNFTNHANQTTSPRNADRATLKTSLKNFTDSGIDDLITSSSNTGDLNLTINLQNITDSGRGKLTTFNSSCNESSENATVTISSVSLPDFGRHNQNTNPTSSEVLINAPISKSDNNRLSENQQDLKITSNSENIILYVNEIMNDIGKQ